MKKLLLEINKKTITLLLNNSATASIIYEAIPITSLVKTWGEEIYFNTKLSIKKEVDAKAVVDFGDIAFWTEGSSIAIGYGKTPISKNNEIRLAAPCNIWARAEFKKSFFDSINDGDRIRLYKN